MRSSSTLMLTIMVSFQAYAQDAGWSPVGLTKELYPIAHLESSWGRNMNHQPHSKGPFFSSYGALGLKAVTAYEAMFNSRRFMYKWSNGGDQTLDLSNKEVFFHLFTTSPQFYNELASVHWAYLRKNTDTIEQAIYAWRWGIGAAQKTPSPQNDSYVASYFKH